MTEKETDIFIHDQGTIVVFSPQTDAVKTWIEGNVQFADYMRLGEGFACEHRYAPPIIEAMTVAGFEIVKG